MCLPLLRDVRDNAIRTCPIKHTVVVIELITPLPPSGAEVLVCQEARDRFESIVSLVGGPEEKMRAQQLLQEVTTIPDADDLQVRVWFCRVGLR